MKALQNEAEHKAFVELLIQEGVTSYLEIGCKFGGSVFKVGSALPTGSRIVAVDLPGGTKVWPESKRSLEGVMQILKSQGQDTHIIWGDSTDQRIINEVRSLGPFDAVLIDANHTLPFVTKDWANYGAMARMVAFHDISWWRPTDWTGSQIDVPGLWVQLRRDYRHVEFREEPADNGIGVLWRD